MDTSKRIEIFRTGTHTDANGQTITFTAADLQSIAASYNPELYEAPIVVGHPRLDDPAYGWVKSLETNGDRLEAVVDQIDTDFADTVRSGRYRKCSAAFYGPHAPNNPVPGQFYLRHVGLLGAHPPAVKGLKRVEFSDDEGVITFAGTDMDMENNTSPTPETQAQKDITDMETKGIIEKEKGEDNTVDQERIKQLEAENTALNEKVAQLESNIRLREQEAIRKASAEFAESLVQRGQIKPADKGTITQLMTTLNDSEQTVEFAEGNKALSEAVKDMLENLPVQVEFGEMATQPAVSMTDSSNDLEFGDAAVDTVMAAIDRKAMALVKEQGISYGCAVKTIMRHGG